MIKMHFIIVVLVAMFFPYNTFGDSADIYSYKTGSKYNISFVKLPCSCGENIIYDEWVYYAPLYVYNFKGTHEDNQELSKLKNCGNPKLIRSHTHTGKVQVLDLSKILKKIPLNRQDIFIGVDKDNAGNIYMVNRKGILLKIAINKTDFNKSNIETLSIEPFNEGFYYINILYHNDYLYVTPMAHGHIIRVPISNFLSQAIEFIDLTSVNEDAAGYNGIAVDANGFIYLAPNYNGKRRTGKIVRINSEEFTTGGVSIIDLERLSPDARGYHGVCIHKDKAVFVPHMNEDAGMHSTAAIVDVNNLNDVRLIDLSLYNTKVGGMINCVIVEDDVWLLPYQKKKVQLDMAL